MKRKVEVKKETSGVFAGREVAWVTEEHENGASAVRPIELNDATPYARLAELAGQRQQLQNNLKAIEEEMDMWETIKAQRQKSPAPSKS